MDITLEKISTNLVRIVALANEIDNLNKNITISGSSKVKADALNKKEKDALTLIEATHNLFSNTSSQQIWEHTTKIHAEKLKVDFQHTLQRFQRIQAEIKRRLIRETSRQEPATADLLGLGDGGRLEYGDLDDEPAGGHQQQMQVNKDGDVHQLSYVLQNEEQMRSLEEDIVNVNTIFEQLQSLVYSQREAVDSIEHNIDSAYTAQEDGTNQLMKAATSRRRSRKRCCICCIVLTTAVAIVVLVLVAIYAPHKSTG